MNTGEVVEVRLYFRSELEVDCQLQMELALDWIVIVSGCELFRPRLSDCTVY